MNCSIQTQQQFDGVCFRIHVNDTPQISINKNNLCHQHLLTLQHLMNKLHDQYARIQQYEGHLKRLIKLKQRPLSHINQSPTQLKSISHSHHNHSQSIKSRRIMTENLEVSRSPLRKIKTKALLPLPLIPQNQKQLVSSSIKDKKLPEREAEIVLQNYLLSRRILNVKSCIKNNSLQKFYKKHQEYSVLRSRSRLSSLNLSESRLKKFKEYESTSLRQSRVLGNGKYTFSFSIQKLQKIRRQSEVGTLYNLVVKVGKKSYKFSNLMYVNLKQNHKFYFRKKDVEYPYELMVEIELIIQNEILKYAWFIIDASEPLCQLKGLPSGKQFAYEKKNQIQGLKSIKSQKLIGTVVFDYQITKRNHQ